jgi:hypothetical protein
MCDVFIRSFGFRMQHRLPPFLILLMLACCSASSRTEGPAPADAPEEAEQPRRLASLYHECTPKERHIDFMKNKSFAVSGLTNRNFNEMQATMPKFFQIQDELTAAVTRGTSFRVLEQGCGSGRACKLQLRLWLVHIICIFALLSGLPELHM